MSSPIRSIDEFDSSDATLSHALSALSVENVRGIRVDEDFLPWSQVTRRASARAAAFRHWDATGPQPEDGARREGWAPPHVGLLLDNSPEFVVWLCAAASSELVAVGLNDTRSPRALAADLRTADVRVVIYDAGHADLAGELSRHTTVPVLPAEEFGGGPADAGPDVIGDGGGPDGSGPEGGGGDPRGTEGGDPDALVALIFTSGTTGDPKAVRITQRKIAVPARMLADRFGIGADDCLYNAMPLFHSNAVLVAWPMALITGCDLALRRRFSASGWLGDVRRFGATFANYVGTPLSYILATPEHPGDADNPVRIVYGNEAGAGVREAFAARFGVRVVDGFGSTEGGVAISRTPDTPAAALGPLPDGVVVVDPETDAPCERARFSDDGALANPATAVGELVREGPGLFAGYYGNPAADAERMRGGRFRTGDLAYVDESGFVYFAGRASTWMRVAGENLAAAPIERALARHPQVAEVAVFGIPADGVPGDEIVAAIVLSAGRAESFAASFGDFLAAQHDLSARQWPRLLRITDELPRTPSFKVRVPLLAARGRELGPRPGDGSSADAVFFRTGTAAGESPRFEQR